MTGRVKANVRVMLMVIVAWAGYEKCGGCSTTREAKDGVMVDLERALEAVRMLLVSRKLVVLSIQVTYQISVYH